MITLWALVVMIRGMAVPTGLEVERFASREDCQAEGRRSWSHAMYRWDCQPVVYKEDP